MTDLLHRLASRATGRRHRPATAPLLPPRAAAERPPREPVGPGDDGASEEVRDMAAPVRDGEASGRSAGTDGPTVDARPVAAPAPQPGPPPAVSTVSGAPLRPAPAPDAVLRDAPADLEHRGAAEDTGTHGRPRVTPLPGPPAATVSPPAAVPAVRPSVDHGGPSAVPHDGRGPGRRRPRLRPAAPDRETARPTRPAETLGMPVARPVPGPAPAPPGPAPRTLTPPASAALADPGPAVTITIGRVEIRAVPPAPHASARPEPDRGLRGGPGASAGTLSLGDFLRGTGDAR
ncbi:hypothetical protein AB0F57_30165 [Streptomyces tanashiensis]|uniref:hypothetical protein n=1 Tax=Streptomyces tanashiensis TaxID=67367 RepID=UPI0033C62F26